MDAEESVPVTDYMKAQSKTDEQLSDAYREYGTRLKNAARRFTYDETGAEDIVQDVFLNVYQKYENYNERSALYTYLYRAVINKSIDYARRNKRRLIETSIENGAADSLQSESFEKRHDLKMIIEKALKTLPEKYSSVLILLEYERLQYKEISFILDIPVNSVRSRVYRAREKLLERLKDAGVQL